jgi:hypothetical protein
MIRSAYCGLRARAEGGDTVLTGVLAEAEALGLELACAGPAAR